jgi:hypothetical protein
MKFIDALFDTHKDPVNRACHGLGALCVLGAASSLFSGRRLRALGWAALGAAFIGAGHAAEGEPPALVAYWRRKPRKVPRKPRRRRANNR